MKMSDNLTKYEVLIEQYLRSMLDISEQVIRLFAISCSLPVGIFSVIFPTDRDPGTD